MSYIRLTVQTADRAESSLVPVLDEHDHMRPEDDVIDALRNLVVDLFYLAAGYPAADILVAGDPWAPRNGDGKMGEPSVTMPHAGISWLGPRDIHVPGRAQCECGHDQGYHYLGEGSCGVQHCGCGSYNPAPAVPPAPAAAEPDLCDCGHEMRYHWDGQGECGYDDCPCDEYTVTIVKAGPRPDPLEEPGTADPGPQVGVDYGIPF
jgi:hypothetical protein